MLYDSKVVKKVLKLSREGFSSRKIAEKLGIKSKSTVNDIINRSGFREIVKKGKGARLLYIDLETAPCIAAVFGRFKINLSQDNIIENGSQLISACWTWDNSEKVYGACMTPLEAIKRDDSRVLSEVLTALENSDIIVYQNGDKFDLPKIRTRCVVNNLPPPPNLQTVDTLKIAKQMGFPSNRLDSLGDYLGVGRKVKHSGVDLWIRCKNGNQEALDEMYHYNEQDVLLLRDVYQKIRAFYKQHPNVANYYDDDKMRCTVCGSDDIKVTGRSIFTNISEFAEHLCNSCGHRMRGRQNLKTKTKMKNTLSN